ncbi:MAG: hypothetical protein ACFE9Z_05640 [Promethearchaeota archaeon]
MKKVNLFFTIFISLLIIQFAFIPTTISEKPAITNLNSSQIAVNRIRIAIYNEPNITETSYAAGGSYTNDYGALKGFLQSEGHQVTELTCTDIYNHELMTADFDIFIMVDNLPRENITKQVKEYWLGGGSILSFDSALAYLCYEGILIPESLGDHGWGTYFAYLSGIDHNVSSRHPITKDYEVEDSFSSAGTWMCFLYWDILLGTSAGADTVKLANRDGQNNYATAVARDPLDEGGRVAHLPGLGNAIGVNMSSMIAEAVQWLCPKPKGRILFDLSHLPYYGIDPWDDYVTSVNYNTWRNILVSRGYTLDKLYPSLAGNFTLNNLRPYDMLFLCIPAINFTSSEVTAVTQWVGNGGGVVAIGENSAFVDENNNVNYLYSNFDLELSSVSGTNGATYFVQHPTIEDCTEISAVGPGRVTYSGDAYPIWGYDASEIYVAGQEYGNGRVLLMGDVAPFRDSSIGSLSNTQYAINVANWLVSWNAEVLLYTSDNHASNYYTSYVAIALNELEIPFYLTQNDDYFNLSLNLKDWNLVIVDEPSSNINPYYGELAEYIESGGFCIMSTWTVDNYPGNNLWLQFGVASAGDIGSGEPVYIWDDSHDIFTNPIDFTDSQFTSDNGWVDDGDRLTVYPNATALAGYTASETVDNAIIVLRNDGKTLLNGYLLAEFSTDDDDSTYIDSVELWINEIDYIWTQVHPITSGIPGYDFYIVIWSTFVSLSLISLVIVKKHKNTIVKK